MKKAKKFQVLLPVVGTAIFLLVIVQAAVRINQKYPAPEVERVSADTAVERDGWALRANEFCILSPEDFLKKFPAAESALEPLLEVADGEEMKLLAVQVAFSNLTQQEMVCGTNEMAVCTTDWSNGFDMFLFMAINGQQTAMSPQLKPGESCTAWYVCAAYAFQFTSRGWQEFEEQPFDLLLSLYPRQQRISLVPE